MVTMKHTIGLAIILSTLAAACGPTFTSGSVGIGDGAVLDDDTADTGVEDAQAADSGRPDASADSGTVAEDAQTPPHDAGQEVDVVVAADAVEQPETDPWPPDGEVLGDPDVSDASADSGPLDTGAVDAGQVLADAGGDAGQGADTTAPPDTAQDAGDGGGVADSAFSRCAVATGCVACVRIPGCVWCQNTNVGGMGRCEEITGAACVYRWGPEHAHLCR